MSKQANGRWLHVSRIETSQGRPPDFFRPGLERIYDIIHPDDLPRVKLTDHVSTGLPQRGRLSHHSAMPRSAGYALQADTPRRRRRLAT